MTAREVHLTVVELAEREGVAVKTVYRWNTEGTGPRRIQQGTRGKVRYRLADVEAWERTQEKGGPAPARPARMTTAQAARTAA